MKILMFGRGVISTQYAWALEKAGHTVEFYVRPGRKAEFGSTVTLNLLDARKKIRGIPVKENWPVTLIEDFNADHSYDLIFVSVQHYHFKKVAEHLSDKVGKATVLLFNNFWEEPLEQVASLPVKQLVWGFPQAGGGFDSKGVLNGSILGGITIGTFHSELTDRDLAVIELFRSAGIKSTISKDFRSWLFGHFAMNAAMLIEILKAKTTMLVAFQTTKHWKNAIANGKGLLPLLKARNVDITKSPVLKIFGVPPWLISFGMKLAIRFLPPLKHSFSNHSNQEEIDSYAKDVMAMAEKLKISLPRYESRVKY
ncbi:ketopantoate reductase [Sphingobacteriaceae bacterium]|nr:ketopantoate reductase [Sphingobacteriaceae bacterium]